jgi:hypothetical protein
MYRKYDNAVRFGGIPSNMGESFWTKYAAQHDGPGLCSETERMLIAVSLNTMRPQNQILRYLTTLIQKADSSSIADP